MSAEADYIITNDGMLYALNRMGVRAVMADNGRGMPPVEYATRRGYSQHGQTVLNYRLQPRVISLQFRDSGKSRDEYWNARRAKLLAALHPGRGTGGSFCPAPLTLRKILPDGQRRDILAYTQDSPAFDGDEPSRSDEFGFVQMISLFCPDPTFFSPDLETTVLTVEENEQMVFPITFDDDNIFFGSETNVGRGNVTNPGTWFAYPQIVITGPYSWIRVTNLTTGASFQLNVAKSTSQVITVDTTPGAISITDAAGVDRRSEVEGNLTDWLLAYAPVAAGGVNTIEAEAGDATSSTTVTIRFYPRYIGM